MKSKNTIVLMLLFVFSLFLSACSTDKQGTTTNETKTDKIIVSVVLYPVEFLVNKIGGDYVEVTNILPPGADMHTFEPTTQDMIKMTKSDFFIYSKYGNEGFINTLTEPLKKETVQLVDVSEGLNLANDKQTEDEHATEKHNHGNEDPHIWIDPLYTIQMAERVKNALSEQMPEQKKTFEANLASLKADLETIDQEFGQLVKDKKDPSILVAHAAYGYWEKRYGIKQISITGLSSTSEPSQKQLEKIIETAKVHKIKYMIFEQNIKPKVASVIQNELKIESLTLHNLESLTDKDIKENKDYLSIMQNNIETLKTALQ